MRPLLLAVCLAALLASAAGGVAATAAVDAQRQATVVPIDVVDNAYEPAAVTVRVGDLVRWSWVGSNRHSVTAPGMFDSHPDCSLLTTSQCGGAGATFEWRPDEVGEVSYSCRIHGAQMTGAIQILPADPDSEPSPEPSPSPAQPSPSASPSPLASPSPSESSSPSVQPSPDGSDASPSPGDEPAPQASPSPDAPAPSSGQALPPSFGPPSPAPTEPLPTISSKGGEPTVADPVDEPELEPFPSPAAPAEAGSPGAVAVPRPDDGGPPGRTAALVLASGALVATLAAVGRFVLFGPVWR